MDNEEFDDEDEPIRRIDDNAANMGVFHGGDDESTARIPAGRVQEETQAYAYGYSDEAQGERYAEEPLERTAPQLAVASPIVGMEEMVSPVSPVAEQADRSRQVIVLPDVAPARSVSGENLRQRAPMAKVNEGTSAGNKSLLSNMLPRIDGDTGAFNATPAARSLDLPSFDTGSQSAVSATGSFSTVGGTGSFAPVGDELVSDVAPEERYIDDADDSTYDEEYTETGALLVLDMLICRSLALGVSSADSVKEKSARKRKFPSMSGLMLMGITMPAASAKLVVIGRASVRKRMNSWT